MRFCIIKRSDFCRSVFVIMISPAALRFRRALFQLLKDKRFARAYIARKKNHRPYGQLVLNTAANGFDTDIIIHYFYTNLLPVAPFKKLYTKCGR